MRVSELPDGVAKVCADFCATAPLGEPPVRLSTATCHAQHALVAQVAIELHDGVDAAHATAVFLVVEKARIDLVVDPPTGACALAAGASSAQVAAIRPARSDSPAPRSFSCIRSLLHRSRVHRWWIPC